VWYRVVAFIVTGLLMLMLYNSRLPWWTPTQRTTTVALFAVAVIAQLLGIWAEWARQHKRLDEDRSHRRTHTRCNLTPTRAERDRK